MSEELEQGLVQELEPESGPEPEITLDNDLIKGFILGRNSIPNVNKYEGVLRKRFRIFKEVSFNRYGDPFGSIINKSNIIILVNVSGIRESLTNSAGFYLFLYTRHDSTIENDFYDLKLYHYSGDLEYKNDFIDDDVITKVRLRFKNPQYPTTRSNNPPNIGNEYISYIFYTPPYKTFGEVRNTIRNRRNPIFNLEKLILTGKIREDRIFYDKS